MKNAEPLKQAELSQIMPGQPRGDAEAPRGEATARPAADDRPLILLGGSGHAKVLAEALAACGRTVLGFVDPDESRAALPGPAGPQPDPDGLHPDGSPGNALENAPGNALPAESAPLPRLGGDDAVLGYAPGTVLLVNGVGSADSTAHRARLYQRFRSLGYGFAPVVHPAAVLSPSASLGEGVQVMAGAVVQAGVEAGANVIVNTGAVVDHDCRLGDHAHVASGAVLAGGVQVGSGAHIGAGATLIQGVAVGASALVAAGAVVIADVAPGARVAGVPARPMRRPTTGGAAGERES
jgi:UDP-perosamine 4-acetyltransferase